jgi:2-oxoglutarate ferredoxin oxidoreductase subunit beta
VPFFEQITVDYNPGETREVEMHDGSLIRLRKTAADYDPTNRAQAFEMLRSCQDSNELLTGLIYVNEEKQDFMTSLHLVDAPLSTLPQKETQPGPDALDEIMKSLM